MKRICLILSLAALLGGAELMACTTAIVSAEASSSGRPMIWKQRDARNKRNCLAYIKGPLYNFTAVVPVSKKAREVAYGGINDVGFAIANNLSYNLREDSDDKASENGKFMYKALGQCRTLEDFRQLLLSQRDSLRIIANFAVIDAEGGAAYFEASESGWARFDVPKGGVLYRTNFSLSGKKDRGSGYERFESIKKIMEKTPKGGYSPEFFFETSRNFHDGLNNNDALKSRNTYIYDNDFIPRARTVSSLVIEGVTASELPNAGMMWFTPGYPPCSYAIAVWVAAEDNLPACVTGEAEANALAVELMHKVHPLTWEGGDDYLEVKALKKILPSVRKAGQKEYDAANSLVKEFRRKGFFLPTLQEYNKKADERFVSFKEKVSKL